MIPILDNNHVYRIGHNIIPGVTTILQSIVDYSMVDPDVLAEKARLGTLVHLATEYDDEGTLDIGDLDKKLLPYVSAWMKFKRDTRFKIELSEHIVYHEKYNYAGMLDRVGILNKQRVLIDIKCVATLAPHVGIQLAAYFNAENAMRSIDRQIKKRFALQLQKNGNYRLKSYEGWEDFKLFTSLLTIYNWRLKHGA